MPTLPIYNSNRNIEANIAAPVRNEVAQPFQDFQKVVGTVAGVTEQWSQAKDVMDYTKFKADSTTAIALQKQAAAEDTNPDNLDAHLKSLETINKKSLDGITNQSVKARANIELQQDLTIAGIEMRQMFNNKQILSTQVKLEESVRAMSGQKSQASTVATGQQIDSDVMSLVQSNVSAGIITPAHGKKLIDDYRLGAVDLDIMSDPSTTKEGSYVYEQLLAGKDGAYAHLSDSERAERLTSTELHIRRNKIMSDYQNTQNQDSNEQGLLSNIGNVTENQVRNMLVNMSIRKSFGDKYIKSMHTAPAKDTEPAAYNKIFMSQVMGRKQQEINRTIVENVGNLTVEDREGLIKKQFDPLDSKTITIKASAEALKKWAVKSLSASEVESNEILYNFFKRLDQNQSNIDQTMQEVQKDYVKKNYPDVTNLPDVPNIIGDRNKILSVYKKESKAGGKKIEKTPVSTVYTTQTISFDDL